MRLSYITPLIITLTLAACDDGGGEAPTPEADAPLVDLSVSLDGASDSEAPPDARLDAGPSSDGPLISDVTAPDATTPDVVTLDAAILDAVAPDAVNSDASAEDAATLDATTEDARMIDAAGPDTLVDGSSIDATPTLDQAVDAAPPEGCLQVDRLEVNLLPPSGLQARFRALDCEGEPLRPLEVSDLTLRGVDDAPLERLAFGPSPPPSRVILVLDLSQAVYDAGVQGEIIGAAQGFVAQLLQGDSEREVALAPFGRLDAFEIFTDFSGDMAQLMADLDLLREGPSRGPSELYGVYVRALARLEERLEDQDEGAAIFLTLAPPTDAQARRAAVNQARDASPARIYTVSVRGENDVAELEALGTPGAGAAWVASADLMGGPLRIIAAELEAVGRSRYALGLCGAPPQGPLSLGLDVDGERLEVEVSYAPDLLSGDPSRCDPEQLQGGVTCTPNAARCEGHLLHSCDEAGRALAPIDCAQEPGQICLGGACVLPECEDGAQEPCGASDEGACALGARVCVAQRWAPCEGAIDPTLEACNGLDDDCDGEIDEELEMLNCGQGACEVVVPSCLDGEPSECTPGSPVDEILNNGIDDDCDGEIDEIGYGIIEGRVVTCPKRESAAPEAGAAEAMAQAKQARSPLRPGQLIALLKPEAVIGGQDAAVIVAQLQPMSPAKLHARRWIGARIISLGFDVDSADRSRAVAQTWAVVEALRGAKIIEAISPEALSRPMRTPTDPLYPLQRWHYELIQLPAAWDLEQGSPDVRVAVLDTGIMEGHPDIAEQLIPGYDFASDGLDGDGWDNNPHDSVSDSHLCDDWNNPDCPHFHGTHVAGTISATGDNGSHGAGVAWGASIQPVRVLGYQGGGYEDIFSGMYWAVGQAVSGVPRNPQPAQILNMSLGGACRPEGCESYGCDDYCAEITRIYEQVADEVTATGALVVVAAGNNDQPASEYLPAKLSRFLTVGAVRPDARRSSYSNFGPAVDVMAPGGAGWYEGRDEDRVWSLMGADDFDALPGTSMAAPHVAGLAALLLSADPGLSGADLRGLISDTSGPVGRCNEGCGEGLINAYAALAQIVTPGATGVLKLASRYLDFGADQTEVTLWFWNTGEGPLEWSAWPDTAGHVSERVALQPESGRLEPGAWGALDVVVLRYGLEEGRYGSFVIIEAGTESGVVPLAFRVGEPCLEIDSVEVIARQYDEAGGLHTVATATAWAGADFAYSLEGIPAGRPTLIEAEANPEGPLEQGDYLGRWPFLSDPEPITVQPEMLREGVDINLAPYLPDGLPGYPGAPCAEDADCEGIEQGVCLAFEGIPGGYCSRWCAEDRWCPIGAACADFANDAAYCLASCEAHGECRIADNQECWAYRQGLDLCLWPSAVPGKVPVGAACVAPEDCSDADGGFCLDDGAGGYCSVVCQANADCPHGSVCIDLGEGQGYCMDYCEAGDHCRRATHGCYSAGEAGVCWAVELGAACASDAECGAGMSCLNEVCALPCQADEDCVQGTCSLFGFCEI